eukprot:m.42277 g.42277  ORF g.42277 m.42277 type:complete len:172 (-) comp19052_c0_seq2:144-659(-)
MNAVELGSHVAGHRMPFLPQQHAGSRRTVLGAKKPLNQGPTLGNKTKFSLWADAEVNPATSQTIATGSNLPPTSGFTKPTPNLNNVTHENDVDWNKENCAPNFEHMTHLKNTATIAHKPRQTRTVLANLQHDQPTTSKHRTTQRGDRVNALCIRQSLRSTTVATAAHSVLS